MDREEQLRLVIRKRAISPPLVVSIKIRMNRSLIGGESDGSNGGVVEEARKGSKREPPAVGLVQAFSRLLPSGRTNRDLMNFNGRGKIALLSIVPTIESARKDELLRTVGRSSYGSSSTLTRFHVHSLQRRLTSALTYSPASPSRTIVEA